MQQEYGARGWQHPYDIDDPDEIDDLLSESRQSMLKLLSVAMDYIDESPKTWGVSFAIGTTNCAGRSMSEIAAKLGCTRADISHHAKAFQRAAKLPPSPYMKAERD